MKNDKKVVPLVGTWIEISPDTDDVMSVTCRSPCGNVD